MRNFALVVACLVCSGSARRVDSKHSVDGKVVDDSLEHSKSSQIAETMPPAKTSPLTIVALLLLALDPSSAFSQPPLPRNVARGAAAMPNTFPAARSAVMSASRGRDGNVAAGDMAEDTRYAAEIENHDLTWRAMGSESTSQEDLVNVASTLNTVQGIDGLMADLDKWLDENPGAVAVVELGPTGEPMPNERPLSVAFSGPSTQRGNPFARDSVVMSATAGGGGDATSPQMVPDMNKRTLMNLILLSSVGLNVGALGVPFVLFFIPNVGGGAGGGLTAKDALGDDVTFDGWLKTHGPGSRQLVQGLKGDATYLIVNKDSKVEDFALNAVCTHLGCVVPWNQAENKFMCPCHGSQYNDQGKVVRGPAPLSLALAHVNDAEGKVSLTPWTETDFRTGEAPWWKP